MKKWNELEYRDHIAFMVLPILLVLVKVLPVMVMYSFDSDHDAILCLLCALHYFLLGVICFISGKVKGSLPVLSICFVAELAVIATCSFAAYDSAWMVIGRLCMASHYLLVMLWSFCERMIAGVGNTLPDYYAWAVLAVIYAIFLGINRIGKQRA